jgi:scaffold protein (connect acetoacetyl-CoA thiolase and HMG-CoA synthase)
MSVARFWRETPRRYNLGGSKCTACGTVYFPPRAVCPECTHHRQSIEKMVPFQLSGVGEVLTYTVVHEPADGFEMQVPYVMALVRTDEGPVLTGQVVDVDPGQVAIGLRVRATFRKLREEGRAGVIHYGYKFAPADQSGGPSPVSPEPAKVPSSLPATERSAT